MIPASNEPSDCLQTFGDCREGQIPRPLGHFNIYAPLLAAGSLTGGYHEKADYNTDRTNGSRKDSPVHRAGKTDRRSYHFSRFHAGIPIYGYRFR